MAEFISQLKSGDDRSQVLRAFQLWISRSESSALSELATDENFHDFFEFFYQAGPDEVVLASEILHKFISMIPVSCRIQRLQSYFISGLENNSSKIREVILKELKICAQDNSALEHLIGNKNLISQIAKLIGDKSLSVATLSSEFLTTIGKHYETASIILSPPVTDVLKVVMSTRDILRFRVYEVVMKLATYSPEILALVAENGYFETLNTDVKSNDDLMLMNCLEVVKDLAGTDHGLKLLDDVGFVKIAGDMISTSLDPLRSFIILPGLLKFFMSIGETQPEFVFHQYSGVVQFLFTLVNESDAILLCIAIDGIGLLGSSLRGKILLLNEGKMPLALSSFRANLQQGSSPEIKFHVIQALSRLLELGENERTPDVEKVLEGWLKRVSNDPGDLMFQMCRQPFLEIRTIALHLMHIVVSREWGQRIMVSVPGFVEFLLDRSTEGTISGKELKFKIIKSIVGSPCFERIFDSETVNKLKDYHQKGPFYVSAQNVVVAVGEPL